MHISGGFPKKPKPKKPQPSGITVEWGRRKRRRRKVGESADWLNTDEESILTHGEDEYPFTPWHQEFPSDDDEDEEINDSSNDDYRKRQVRTFSIGPASSNTGSTKQVVEKVEPPSRSPTDDGHAPPKPSNATSEVPGFYFTRGYEGDIYSGRYLSKSAIEGQMNYEFAITGRRKFDIVQVLGDGTRIYVHYEYDRTGHLHATRQLEVVREYPQAEEETIDDGNDAYASDPEQQSATDEPVSSGAGNPDGEDTAQPTQEYETWDGGAYVILNPGTEDEEYVFFNSKSEQQEYIQSLVDQGWTRQEPDKSDDSGSSDDWESEVWDDDGSLSEEWESIPEADDSFWSESGLG